MVFGSLPGFSFTEVRIVSSILTLVVYNFPDTFCYCKPIREHSIDKCMQNLLSVNWVSDG